MATIRERLVYAIDVVGDGARKGLNGIKTSIAEADGAFGKFKAGATSAMASIGASAGTLGIAAGGALVAFGAKAVAASQDVALAAGKLAESTGLTVEQASRLNEVASDLNISGETLTSVVKKMSVEIGKGNPLLEQYGIALQMNADGSADVNATLLDTIRRIGAIEDPTKRAAAAQAAFGRGYADAAELIFSNADKLQKKLDDVSDAKVVTPEELKRARDFRDSLKNLQDVAEDLTVIAGSALVPAMQAVTDELTTLATGAEDAADAIKKIPGVPDFIKFAIKNNPLGQQIRLYQGIADAVDKAKDSWSSAGDEVRDLGDKSANAGPKFDIASEGIDGIAAAALGASEDVAAVADEVVDLGDKAANAGPKFGDLAGAFDDAAQHLADLNDEARDNALNTLASAAQGVADAIDDAFSRFEDSLDVQDLLDDITDQFGKVAEAQSKVTEDGDQGVRNYNRSVRELRRMIRDLLEDIKGIPPDKKVQILTEIERGSIDDLYRILGDLTKGVTVPVSFATAKTAGFSGANVDFNLGAGTIAPVINNPTSPSTPVPIQLDQRTQTFIFPVGTTPTTQYQMGVLDRQRNGERTSL